MVKTIAVTGSSGFVGSKLVTALKNSGFSIVELDQKDGFDLNNFDSLKDIPKFDLVYHLAAKTYVPDAFINPHDFYYNNVVSTLNMLELCRKNNSRMVFASSYVYGEPEYLPIDEKHPIKAFNPYGQSKIMGEQLCESYNRDFGLSVMVFRPFNIYGLGQHPSFLLPTIIEQVKTGKVVLKDPRPKRDFVFIDDVISAYVKAVDYKESKFEVFNIGSGKSYSVKETVEKIVSTFNPSADIEFTNETRPNEVLDTVADITKIKKLLGWEPKTNFEDGLKSFSGKIK